MPEREVYSDNSLCDCGRKIRKIIDTHMPLAKDDIFSSVSVLLLVLAILSRLHDHDMTVFRLLQLYTMSRPFLFLKIFVCQLNVCSSFIAEGEIERKKRLDQERNDRMSYQHQRFSAFTVQNILWLIASMAAFHFTDFHAVVLYDPRVNRWDKFKYSVKRERESIVKESYLSSYCIRG